MRRWLGFSSSSLVRSVCLVRTPTCPSSAPHASVPGHTLFRVAACAPLRSQCFLHAIMQKRLLGNWLAVHEPGQSLA
jgi:hypothetical protein